MMSKEWLLLMLKEMPEKFSMDDLLDRIALLQKMEMGLQQSESKQTYSVQGAKRKLGNYRNIYLITNPSREGD